MLARPPRASVLWLCSALLCACGGTQILDGAQGPCVEGQSASCDCDDGSTGVQLCGSDSRYGACDCPTGASGTTGGTGPVAGTTGGAAGSAGMTIDPVAGTGAAGGGGSFVPGGAGGVGGMTGGASGTTGGASGMSGGLGGMTGGAPATGGSGGSAGTSGGSGGTSATGGSGGSSGPGRDPRPGELYGDCLASGACKDGLLCISDGSSGFPMSYCTTTCGGFDQMGCPSSRGGQAATCVLGICVR